MGDPAAPIAVLGSGSWGTALAIQFGAVVGDVCAERRRVTLVVTCNRLQHERCILNGAREGPDLVE